MTALVSSTSVAGSVMGTPSTVTRSSRISCSAARRDATPALERNFERRIACHHRAMDMATVERTLGDLGEPGYRARQIWRWAAQGAADFQSMTDVPAKLRASLEDQIPFSTLTVEHESYARDGTIKTLFRTADGRPLEAVLMRYRDGR